MGIYADYHIHTTFSADGQDNTEAACRVAIERGLREVCFTEHVDLIPWDDTRGFFKPEAYMAEVERCRAQFASQLSIRAGLEVSEPHLVSDQVMPLLAEWPFDFVLGSAHWIDQSGVYLSELYDHRSARSRPAEEVEREYLKRVLELVEQADFDSLGHLDLVRRYRPLELGPFDPTHYADLVHAILRTVVERDKAIEINTSPLRRGRTTTSPDLTVLRWYRQAGGEKLTLGSDSHRAEYVAAGIDVAMELARSAGFSRIVRFERRQPEWVPLA